MNITQTTTTTNRIDYRTSEDRLTAADLTEIARDIKARKVPRDAKVVLSGAKCLSVTY